MLFNSIVFFVGESICFQGVKTKSNQNGKKGVNQPSGLKSGEGKKLDDGKSESAVTATGKQQNLKRDGSVVLLKEDRLGCGK